MNDIGFGIIGIGRQGLRLAEHIRKDIKHAKLAAICRRSEIGIEYSKKHGVKFYSDYQALLKDEDVDVVIITTPSSLHGVQALDALKSKKHILIDKPISLTLKEARKIIDQAEEEKLTVAVNFPLRVNPVTKAIKSNLNKIGKLKKVQVIVSHGPLRNKWQSDLKLAGGGVIFDLGSHYFDLLTFLTGCQPVIINNAYSEKSENEHCGFIDFTYKEFSASVVLLRDQKLKKNIITCVGTKGLIYADYAIRQVIVSNNYLINKIKCPTSFDLEIILHNLVRAINKKEEVTANAEAGLNSLKTALAVYQAIKIGKSFKL